MPATLPYVRFFLIGYGQRIRTEAPSVHNPQCKFPDKVYFVTVIVLLPLTTTITIIIVVLLLLKSLWSGMGTQRDLTDRY